MSSFPMHGGLKFLISCECVCCRVMYMDVQVPSETTKGHWVTLEVEF